MREGKKPKSNNIKSMGTTATERMKLPVLMLAITERLPEGGFMEREFS